MAVLCVVKVKAADVLNAHVTAANKEKIWTVLNLEFWDDAGMSPIIVRALYGLKRAGAFFIAHFAEYMNALGYESFKADLNLL